MKAIDSPVVRQITHGAGMGTRLMTDIMRSISIERRQTHKKFTFGRIATAFGVAGGIIAAWQLIRSKNT